MTQEVINVSEATVKTVTIEVKVIQINNRQMTLAVFRQLPEGHIFDKRTGGLRGMPWGKVRYRWEENIESTWDPKKHNWTSMRTHGPIHILWEGDGNLYRDDSHDWLYDIEGDERTQSNHKISLVILSSLDQIFIAV